MNVLIIFRISWGNRYCKYSVQGISFIWVNYGKLLPIKNVFNLFLNYV